MAATDREEGASMRDYARMVWRRKWIVIGVVVALTAAALAYSYSKTPMYEASARLIYTSQIDVSDPLSSGGSVDSSTLQIELGSVDGEIASPDIKRAVKADVGDVGDYTVSAAPDTSESGETGNVNTVSITAESSNAEDAASVANAYADAFVAARKSAARTRIQQAERVVKSQLNSFKTEASRLSADYISLTQKLQDLQILEGTVTGNFRVLVPASVPAAPYTPKPLRDGAIGLFAGLIIGVGIALFAEQFDTRVRTQDEVVAIFGTPLLAHIRKLRSRQVEERPLVVLSGGHNPAAESIRKLRGNLEFANVDGDLRSIFFSSALQHEGKTFTVCNLALALAAVGNRVALVDGDLRRPQVHRYLNLPNATGLSTVLTGRTPLETALVPGPVSRDVMTISSVLAEESRQGSEAGLMVLTSGPVPPNAAEMIASKSFAALVERLEAMFDIVIVDAPALLAVGDSEAIAACVDGLVFLVDLTRARRPLLVEAAHQIERMPCRKLGLVVMDRPNGSRRERDSYAYYSQGESPLDDPGRRGDFQVNAVSVPPPIGRS